MNFLAKEKIFELVGNSKCITDSTVIGLEGGEFLLHPDALEIMQWFRSNHPNYDLLSNCLKPDKLIHAVKLHKPRRLWISLDGDKETYKYMRGRDGYENVLNVIEALKDVLPVSVMFTLSPYNDYDDLQHVAEHCKKAGVDLRVGVYNDISFFDTIEKAHLTEVGSRKDLPDLSFSEVKQIQKEETADMNTLAVKNNRTKADIPAIIKEFSENYDFLVLYDQWRSDKLRLRCFSILDSLIVLPNGDVPLCQNLDIKLGNINNNNLDDILRMPETIKTQKHYSENCNACWINYHRKFDVVLYRNLEKYFGQWAVRKMFGFYQWDTDSSKTYKDMVD